MLGSVEERSLGGEETKILALVIQAAVPAAHAVATGHGGGRHRVDGHEDFHEDRFWHQSGTMAAKGSAELSLKTDLKVRIQTPPTVR